MRRLRAPAARKERRGEVEQEIIRAAEEFLKIRPFRELSADTLMAQTGLTRTAFYRYFPDIPSLVLRLYGDIRGEVTEAIEHWTRNQSNSHASMRLAIERVADVYRRHGEVLRAMAEASAFDDEIGRAYEEGAKMFIAAIRNVLDSERSTARLGDADSDAIAAALMWMAERYLTREFADADEQARSKGVDALVCIFSRVIYSD